MSRAATKSPSVLWLNRVCKGTCTPSIWRRRETIWVASNEWPPSSKKLSPRPTCSSFNTSHQMAATCCSSSLRGAM
ncbi:hypothetical protein D9M71_217360 [compost metagenome]